MDTIKINHNSELRISETNGTFYFEVYTNGKYADIQYRCSGANYDAMLKTALDEMRKQRIVTINEFGQETRTDELDTKIGLSIVSETAPPGSTVYSNNFRTAIYIDSKGKKIKNFV